MTSFKVFLILQVLYVKFILVQGNGQWALLREVSVPTVKRSAELLPDHIPLKISTNDGDFHLVLERNKELDQMGTKVIVDHGNGKREEIADDKQANGFYLDDQNNAVVHVEIVNHNGQMKRTYTGSLIRDDQAYELAPVDTDSGEYDSSLHQRAHQLTGNHLHQLKAVDIQKFIRQLDQVSSKPLSIRKPDSDLTDDKLQVRIDNVDKSTMDSSKADKVDQEERSDRKERRENLLQNILDMLENDKRATEQNRRETNKRKRRYTPATPNYYVDLVFLLDSSIFKYWKHILKVADSKVITHMKKIYVHIFNGMYMAFKRITKNEAGFTVTLILRKIEIKTQKDGYLLSKGLVSGGNLNLTLLPNALFDEYRKKQASDYSWLKVDHLMTFSRMHMIEGGYETVGFSPMCGVCEPYYGYSIVKDKGFFSWLTATHELAHSLGAYHDGGVCPDGTYIMSKKELLPSSGSVILPFQFSSCSINEMRACLSGKRDRVLKFCLLDNKACKTSKTEPLNIKKAIGEMIGREQQCPLFDSKQDGGVGKNTCNPVKADICSQMKCRSDGGDCVLPSAPFRALPGTSCGSNKWCVWGKCVTKKFKQYSDIPFVCKERALKTPPAGCEDIAKVCQEEAMEYPFFFFTENTYKTNCKATIYKYQLHFPFENPCN